jgi:F-type H+-transporting ATPase subunit delta
MSEFKVASRYAKSLIDLSTANGTLEIVKGDMEQFIAVLRSNKELQAVLKNPIMKQDKKSAILNGIFKDKIHPSIASFFNIMVRKSRAGILYATAQEFIREYNEVKGIVKATVTSAAPMAADKLEQLRLQIGNQIGAEVILSNPVDPKLIGGFIVKVGDRQIDVSIEGRLQKLERHFAQQVN